MAGPSSRRPGRSSPSGRRPARTASNRPAGTARKPAPPTKAGSGPRLTTRAIVLLSVVLLLIASYTSSLHAWWEARGDIQATRAEIAMRKDAIADLADDEARWDDPAFVEQQARDRFGWVMPGEVGYRVIGADGTVRGDVPTLAAPPAPSTRPWYDKLWGSVEQSGQDPVQETTPKPSDEPLEKQ